MLPPNAVTKKRVGAETARLLPKAGRGRPPVHQETWSKVSVVLFDRQIVHLDRLATDIRGKNGNVMNRAQIIRALIDGLIDSGMASPDRAPKPTCARGSRGVWVRRSVERNHCTQFGS